MLHARYEENIFSVIPKHYTKWKCANENFCEMHSFFSFFFKWYKNQLQYFDLHLYQIQLTLSVSVEERKKFNNLKLEAKVLGLENYEILIYISTDSNKWKRNISAKCYRIREDRLWQQNSWYFFCESQSLHIKE